MDWVQGVDRLQLHDYFIIDEQVEDQAVLDAEVFVDDWNRNTFPEWYPSKYQFMPEAFRVNRFQ